MSEPSDQVFGTDHCSAETERFDQHTATIPEVIRSDEPPEIISPGAAAAVETGWPIWDVQQIARLPFFFLAKRYGDLWELEDQESEAIARAWKPLLDRYLRLEDTAWGTAAMVTLAICGPRAMATDWNQGKKNGEKTAAPGKRPTSPASTKTAGSTGSPVSSESGKAEKVPEWGIFADAPTG